MAILQKLDIQTARDRTRETVEVPEWGGEVIVSELGAADSISLWADPSFRDPETNIVKMALLAPALVARCIVDEQGNRVFDDGDAAMLATKSIDPFQRVASVAMRLNGMSVAAQADVVKNSVPSQSDVSSSDSP